jgi:hypothetical protein
MGAGLRCDRLRQLWVDGRLAEDRDDPLALNRFDELGQVTRARVRADVKVGEDRADESKPVFIDEVPKRVVVRHDPATDFRDLPHQLPDLGIRGLQPADESLGVREARRDPWRACPPSAWGGLSEEAVDGGGQFADGERLR